MQEDIPRKNKEITVLPKPDGSLEFEIVVVNISNVQAKNGVVLVRECEACTFAKEPEGSVRPVGAPVYDRERDFTELGAGIGMGIPLKIVPPKSIHRFEVDIRARCENCEVREKDSLFVNF
jgi:hypothetical protein